MAQRTKKSSTPEQIVLSEMRLRKGRGSRQLKEKEIEYLIKMFAAKLPEHEFDVMSLAPAGSMLSMVAHHFQNTDISYALPIMHTAMIAASMLTQSGAYLEVRGIGKIRPTLWTIGLAESGSAKTLASDEITKIFSDDELNPVRNLPESGSDAQWIVELAEHNGSFWFVDEVGKQVNSILHQSLWARMKPWMLKAYSHQPISNRLKGEKQKLHIADPHFTFHGLSVFSTWKTDINASSMLDGFCQRFNFFIADKRADTDMYDHFLYFAADGVDENRAKIKRNWDALCLQPNAFGAYTLNDDVIPFLAAWWSDLRNTVGKSGLPDSFVRRIGFSIMKYLIVFQFLLGKSRLAVDLETARLATKFAEYHMQSALIVLQDYDKAGVSSIQKIVDVREDIRSNGGSATARTISRKLSKRQREELPVELIKKIVAILDKLESSEELFGLDDARTVKTAAMCARHDEIEKRLKLNERKRNERRLRELRNASRGRQSDDAAPEVDEYDMTKIVPLAAAHRPEDPDPFDLTG